MPRIYLTLAERFLILRRRTGMTQVQLARVLGVGTRTISRTELNEATPIRRTRERFKLLEQRVREREHQPKKYRPRTGKVGKEVSRGKVS